VVFCKVSNDPRKQPKLAHKNYAAQKLVAMHTDAYSGEWLFGRARAGDSMIDLEGS
jgi:hypothetical protein